MRHTVVITARNCFHSIPRIQGNACRQYSRVHYMMWIIINAIRIYSVINMCINREIVASQLIESKFNASWVNAFDWIYCRFQQIELSRMHGCLKRIGLDVHRPEVNNIGIAGQSAYAVQFQQFGSLAKGIGNLFARQRQWHREAVPLVFLHGPCQAQRTSIYVIRCSSRTFLFHPLCINQILKALLLLVKKDRT